MTSTLWQRSPLYDELSVLVAGVTVLLTLDQRATLW